MKVSQYETSVVAKNIKSYDDTGSHEDRHRNGRPRVRRLCESGLRGRIAAKKPLLKDTNKKERLAWAKKQEQWTLGPWKSVLWSGVQI